MYYLDIVHIYICIYVKIINTQKCMVESISEEEGEIRPGEWKTEREGLPIY